MPVRLRLARHGQRHTPVFHIVAINSSKRRDARPLEKLGEYDPIPRVPASTKLPSSSYVFGEEKTVLQKEKRIEWNVERIRYWLGVGAQPSRPVVKLLERVSRVERGDRVADAATRERSITDQRYRRAFSSPPTLGSTLGRQLPRLPTPRRPPLRQPQLPRSPLLPPRPRHRTSGRRNQPFWVH